MTLPASSVKKIFSSSQLQTLLSTPSHQGAGGLGEYTGAIHLLCVTGTEKGSVFLNPENTRQSEIKVLKWKVTCVLVTCITVVI